jgi:phosphate transport system substrate-binding protein
MRRTLYFVFAALLILSMVLAGCSPAAATEPAAQAEPTEAVVAEPAATEAMVAEPAATEAIVEAPTADAEPTEAMAAESIELPQIIPSDLPAESINIAGSSTVFPVTEAIAELFQQDGFGGQVPIAEVGSGAGFERFCVAGETDISNASRAIKDSEIESCQALDPARNPIEFRVGTDALAIVVNPENDWVENVTLEELAMLLSDETETWSDINPEWPDEPILRFVPGTDSGTFDFFIEVVMTPAYGDDADAGEAAFLNAANLSQSENDNVLVEGVEGNLGGIGFFGFAYYINNAEGLKILSVDGVEPNGETAESGEYPLARPLFIYSDAGIMQAKPQVAGFINYYLTNVNDIISEVGYFPASEAAIDAAKQAYLDAVGQ